MHGSAADATLNTTSSTTNEREASRRSLRDFSTLDIWEHRANYGPTGAEFYLH
jgi:hypothetical protein